MKLEVGKRYYTRDGQIAQILEYDLGSEGDPWPYVGVIEGYPADEEFWSVTGGYAIDSGKEHYLDLVSEVP